MKKSIISAILLLLAAVFSQAQNITVHGTVVSATDNEPLIGASVVCGIEGPSLGVATDIDGNFEITVPNGANLIVSYIGYKTQTIQAESKMIISLEEDNELLDEVVVIGYTTQRKVDVTGAISSVDVKEMAKQNENNPMKALQGRVPGMNISADGGPSGSATVRIRGIGTLNNNDPLYIIDGIPTKGGMHELNPNDIESIQVLKDAASASIYGSRAANGVIIITTKKGNDLKITLDASIAAQFYAHRMKVLNAEGYGRAMWQAYVNGGEDPNTNGLGYKFNWGYDNNGYPTFPSVSMGWRLNNESFLKDQTWLDDLKLRLSWGQTGNQEISNLARYFVYVPNYGVSESGGQSFGTSYDIAGTNGGSILQSGFKRN